jgi:S-adenosylmethionine decarboxylase
MQVITAKQIVGPHFIAALGQHLLADLFGIAPSKLADDELLRSLLELAAGRSGLHPITEPIVVSFKAVAPEGQAGVTGFIVLAESHIAFHSYPELGFLAVDVFTCGANANPQAALDVFVERFEPERTVVHSYARGDSSADQ